MRKSLILALIISLGLGFMGSLYAAQTTGHHATSHTSKASEATTSVDINSATAEQLMTLKGIGKKRAEAIIAYRQAHGSFQSADGLKNVKGISQKVIDANKTRITIG